LINTNLASILHRFPDIAFDVQNRYMRLPLLCLTPLAEGFRRDDLRKILSGCQQMATVPYGVEILRKISIG